MMIISVSKTSKKIRKHYSCLRMDAKGTALHAIAFAPDQAILGRGVHQDVHQLQEDASSPSAKALIKFVNVRGREPLTPACKAERVEH